MMRSFMYIVEIILTTIIFATIISLIRSPPNINSILSSLSNQNLLYEFSIAFTNSITYKNVINNNLDFLSYIAYSSLNNHINLYNMKIDQYSEIFFNNIQTLPSCIAFLYPFINILNIQYFTNFGNQALPYFEIYNGNFIPCSNFSFSPDWYIVIINNNSYNYQGQYTNLSLSFLSPNLYNKYLDPYSIFAYNEYLQPIPIYFVNVTYTQISSIYISNLEISLNPIPQGTPIILFLRFKNNINSPNLQYLNNYHLSNNITNAQSVSYNYEQADWMTIYVSSDCLYNNYLIIKYSIPPSIVQYNINNTGLNISSCSGNINIYYSKPINPVFYGNFLSAFNLYTQQQEYKYYSFSLMPDGLNIVKFTFYGS